MDMNLSKLREVVEDRGAWSATVHEVAKNWTQLSDWTTTIFKTWNTLQIKVGSTVYQAEKNLKSMRGHIIKLLNTKDKEKNLQTTIEKRQII